MTVDGGKPMVGDKSNKLGIRPGRDIPVDGAGNVAPRTGGMSVAPRWRDLPPFLIPKRLKHLAPEARGSKDLACWTMGVGPFEAASVSDRLEPRPSGTRHGVVEPNQPMSVVEFQDALAATRDAWTIDEI
jgi:hypothetical protein